MHPSGLPGVRRYFAVWFHLRMRAGGLLDLVRFPSWRLLLRPSWAGYMRPFCEQWFTQYHEQTTGRPLQRRSSFEESPERYLEGSSGGKRLSIHRTDERCVGLDAHSRRERAL